MRKLVSLGLFALVLSMLSFQTFADDVETFCKPLKDKSNPDYAPGLYGLCVAWHNADEEGKEDIENNYRRKSGGEEPPWLETADTFDCPCWNVEYTEICALAEEAEIIAFSQNLGMAMLIDYDNDLFTAFVAQVGSCGYTEQVFSTGKSLYQFFDVSLTTGDDSESETCVAERDVIAGLLANGFCD